MENTEIIDVRVVETTPDYGQALKLALVSAAAPIVLMAVTDYMKNSLAPKLKQRRINKANAKKIENDPT